MAQPSRGSVVRRAPRLRPDERIGAHMTRAGRFAGIDPLVAKPVPALARVVGIVGWAVLTVESLRRARARAAGSPHVAP